MTADADDIILVRIERFNQGQGGGVVVERRQGGYNLRHEQSGAPIARLRPTGTGDKMTVLCWLGKWSQVGDFGGITLPLDEALAYIVENDIFWTAT